MRDQDFRWIANEPNDPEDDLDRVLNTALALYATVEEREGLELRILANLRSQEAARRTKLWRVWGFAVTALALVIFAVAWRISGHTRPPIVNHPATPQNPVEHIAPQRMNDSVAKSDVPVRRRIARQNAASNANPKLDQFPSPRPMSEQETLLAMYINQDPNHAALVAEARMEALRQDEEEKMRIAFPDDPGIGR